MMQSNLALTALALLVSPLVLVNASDLGGTGNPPSTDPPAAVSQPSLFS